MATILLSAAGGAIGASMGGSVLGLSSAVIGRAAGATLGRVIDEKLLGAGSQPVEHGRISRFRLTGASEGAPVACVHGRVRLAGQVIWASRFREQVSETGGGKGGPPQPKLRSYAYTVSLAVALCEGPITRVGRVWADGEEIAKSDLSLTVHRGTEEQEADAKIAAVEGLDNTPAYRGIAYVVIEDLDLGRFGNRVPQFSFEVMRTGAGDVAETTRAVAVIPGTGEYALATTQVTFEDAPGRARAANVNSASGETDFVTALDAMTEELPNCAAASLVVSWFGDDLRCGQCRIRPRAEQTALDASMPWEVSGLARGDAGTVPAENGRPVYGGTPTDQSVVEAIAAMRDAGQAVTFYPFVLMEQTAGNDLPDPWTGGTGQPALPWRGRITTSLAPGREGSPDGSAAAEAEVADFFGSAVASEFDVSGTKVGYAGGDGFTYRRFVLHYAHLCKAAGGVDAFCIGSEMRELTTIRGAGGSFPAVAALRALAAEVRAVLGPGTRIGYAADWSEYFGYQPRDGSGDVYFHLDPLWADPAIDFVGIDNYMPVTDWRDGDDHADAAYGSIYDAAYLKGNFAGGEGFDWYYAGPEAEAVQIRTPIEDGAHDEAWVFRYKDLRNWWSRPHHERIGGVRQAAPTAWQPGSKPIWFTEIGCAAIDKGSNQPNRFLDPKSSESGLPRHSDGSRDDALQAAFLTAAAEYWEAPENNPAATAYQGRMVDTSRIFVWAWDARPWPQFPGNAELWSDGENYARGHWLSGRASARSLASVVKEICHRHGVSEIDVSRLHGVVRGYAVEGGGDGRGALQPLILAHGIDVIERDGVLVFRNRDGRAGAEIAEADLVEGDEGARPVFIRESEAETAGRLRIGFVEADGDYQARSAESIFPDEATVSVAESELPLVLTGAEGHGLAERFLAEARVARQRARFTLPPSSPLGAGDVVRLDGASWRIDRVSDAWSRLAEAVRVEPGLYRRGPGRESVPAPKPALAPVPVWATVMNLPLPPGGDGGQEAPVVAATAAPWPGSVAVYAAGAGEDLRHETLIERPSVMGTTLTALPRATPGLWDRGPALRVRLAQGALSAIGVDALLAGGNAAAIGLPGGDWELFQFRDAVLVAPDEWDIAMRLRGQRGTDGVMPQSWAAGATFVLLDESLARLSPVPRGAALTYRVGPAAKAADHAAFRELTHVADPVGLRPFAPVHLRAAPRADGGVDIGWVRRTRIGGDDWTAWEVPLAEQAERYELRIVAGGVERRRIETTAPGWTYTAADRVADGTTAGFEIEVAQISDLYGPGLFGKAEFNG